METARGDAGTGGAGTASGGACRWPQMVGFAAGAWGMFFALEHLYWVVTGRFEVGASGHDAGSVALAGDLSVLLFVLLALYPVALVWPFRPIGQRRLQISLLAASYGTMILLNLSSYLFSWSGFGLYPVGVCVVGVLVAFVRPRHRTVPQWMVLVATWAFGVGMTIYGGAYVYVAFLRPVSETFLTYLLVGGMNWTVEGLLFMATAWLAGRSSAYKETDMMATTGRQR